MKKRILKQIGLIGLGGLFILMEVGEVRAASYYVMGNAVSASDNNSGLTTAAPWRTIQKAANTLIAGDTVVIGSGTYTENIIESTSGTALKPIIYTIDPGSQVNINGMFNIAGDYVILDGKNEVTFYTKTNNWNWSGVIEVSGSNNIVQGCQVRDSTRIGMVMEPSSSNNIFKNNIVAGANCDGIFINGQNQQVLENDISGIYDCYQGVNCGGYPDNNAIYVRGTNHVVRGNYLHDMSTPMCGGHTDIVQTSSQGTNPNERAVGGLIFEKNVVRHYMGGMYTFMFESNNPNYPVQDVVIKNNLFQVNNGFSSDNNYYLTNLYIYNNTWIGNPKESLFTTPWNIQGSSTFKKNINLMNNITVDYKGNGGQHGYISGFTPSTNDYQLAWNSDGTVPGGMKVVHTWWGINPQFANFGGGDFSLTLTSPILDRGATLVQVTDDLKGISRPQGNGYEVGAYEYKQMGIIDTPTMTKVVEKLGDANRDGRVDDLDYIIWVNNYGKTGASWGMGDFNKDLKVDDLDYVIWASNYGK